MHVLSKIEPVVYYSEGIISSVEIDYITDTEHGDTVGFIDWKEVSALTWRYAPLADA